jgi:hypothetical protein
MTQVRYGVVRTSGWAGWLIRVATRSTVNHAFVVNGPTIIEANPSGLAYGKVAKYYPAAILSEPIEGKQADAVWAWSVAHLGTGYGWLDILAIALAVARFPTPKWAVKRLTNTNTLICSQAVATAYTAAGIHLGNKPPAATTPGDLLHVLHNEPEPANW